MHRDLKSHFTKLAYGFYLVMIDYYYYYKA